MTKKDAEKCFKCTFYKYCTLEYCMEDDNPLEFGEDELEVDH